MRENELTRIDALKHSKTGENMTIGIVSYGAYVPRYRIKIEEIARLWGDDAEALKNGLMVYEKLSLIHI